MTSINAYTLAKLRKLISSPSLPQEDMARWYLQGFHFCVSPNFGLKQKFGGPCGILAVVQAEMIKSLYFSSAHPNESIETTSLENAERDALFIKSIMKILCRANSTKYNIAIRADATSSQPLKLEDIKIFEFSDTNRLEAFLVYYLSQLSSTSGCFLFLISLLLTRGIEFIQNDMDDPENTMIGQYGHCNQELLNLLLTGRATSNVFDNQLMVDSVGLSCKGILEPSDIGYLSLLEAMRYLKVGRHYKTPKYPVWVLGSSTHFTVLYSTSMKINTESREDQMLADARQYFKELDKEETGFITTQSLPIVLEKLGVHSQLSPQDLNRLTEYIKIDDGQSLAPLTANVNNNNSRTNTSNTGIILWSTFWETVSKLMVGKSIDEALRNNNNNNANAVIPMNLNDDGSWGISDDETVHSRYRSDSELARELQAECDAESSRSLAQSSNDPWGVVPTTTATATITPPIATSAYYPYSTVGSFSGSGGVGVGVGGAEIYRTDSEVARELQAQFQAEERESLLQFPQTPITTTTATVMSPPSVSAISHSNSNSLRRHDSIAEENAESFPLFHYNGLEEGNLRQPQLTSFLLYRRSERSCIGMAAVPLDVTESFNGNGINPIEEVLRTRWPGCRLEWQRNDKGDLIIPKID